MKKIWSCIVSLFAGKKKPPVIVVPPIDKPEEKPKVLDWKDRRMIGMVMLANYIDYTGTDNFMNGDIPFDQWIINHANECVKNMKDLNAQGCIVWDPEGTKFPRPLTYYGDPTMAPEKVDIFFRIIKQHGFRTGICIRPDVISWEHDIRWNLAIPKHYAPLDPLENMIEKVEYAIKRWGCSLFYVDSNKLAPAGTDNTDGHGGPLPPSMFAALLKRFPDCLFIPEHTYAEYDQYTAPLWHKGWAADMRQTMTVIDAGDTNWWDQTLIDAVHNGHILMGRVWWDAPELPKIKMAYAKH